MNVEITTTCPICGKQSKHLVDEDAYADWKSRKKLIQDAFPQMSADEREELKTGICKKCWDSMFSDDQEDDKGYEVVEVKSKAEISALGSSMAIEGCATTDENLQALLEFLKGKNAIKDGVKPKFCIIKGKLMNDACKLTGTNRYADDLNIVAVDQSTVSGGSLVIGKFEIGGRWLDDIIDNNKRREHEAKR